MAKTSAVKGRKWTLRDARELFNIGGWGAGYFDISRDGNVTCSPTPGGPSVDLKLLVDDLRRRGLSLPILVRFSQILRHRIFEINGAFQRAIDEYDYGGTYQQVMPIKVNQQRHVVEELLDHGRAVHLGLEAGSKPELLVALALLGDPEAICICNGYKDTAYIETALLATKLGRNMIIVVDRYDEVELIIAASKKLGVTPRVGFRARLAARGAGRWNASSGEKSKFGLSASELVRGLDLMKAAGLGDAVELLHFHLGSQITAVRAIKDAMREVVRVFADLCKLGAKLRYLDVGGGLAVDYDGSKTNFHSSMNYSLQEYANDIVWALHEMCTESGVAPPIIVSESGRALVAHHSMLLFNVLGVHAKHPDPESVAMIERSIAKPDEARAPALDPETGLPVRQPRSQKLIRELLECIGGITRKNCQEAYHDLIELKEEAATLFNHGLLSLKERAEIEDLVRAGNFRVAKIVEQLDYVPEDLEQLPQLFVDTYYCNFSLFQSVPDHWAVKHLFPVMPIHRLLEQPTRRAILVDLTCDSDGKIDQFIDLRDVSYHLPVHEVKRGEDYIVGVFLVGAYQETLGDLHNLFGDTNAVHVEVGERGYRLKHVVEGDSVAEVLSYVRYDREHLMAQMRSATEDAVEAHRLTLDEARTLLDHYDRGLSGYTYLEPEART